MSIANNGTQPMSSMQAMRGQATGVGGGMIMTNSNMGSMGNVGMGGGGLVVNSLKQQSMASGGGMMMNTMQPNNQQGMHHPMHQNSMQNGPMGAGIRMNMQQQHMGGMQRMPNQHMMSNQRMVLSQPQQVFVIAKLLNQTIYKY